MKDKRYNLVRPDRVLSEVAEVVPGSVRGNITIIGSLAAAYWLLDSKGVRTKDVDCVLSPRLTAVEKGRLVMEELLKAGWKQMTNGDFGKPGDENTPVKWPEIWVRGMRAHFQKEEKDLLERAGDGLREMLDSPEDMQQAYQTCVNGLLAGKGSTIDQLRAVGKRILGDVIDRLQT